MDEVGGLVVPGSRVDAQKGGDPSHHGGRVGNDVCEVEDEELAPTDDLFPALELFEVVAAGKFAGA